METNLGDLEESKENVLPLRRGRKIAALQAAADETTRDGLAQEKQQFETELRLYTGEDELEIWYNYILWVEQNYPKGGQEGNLPVLLKRCLNRFMAAAKYKDDERYIDCWLKFLRYSPSTLEVFMVMDANEIGQKSAAFYEAWSWHLEQLGNFRKANKILQEGIENNAQPLGKLIDAQKQLNRKFVQQFSSLEQKEEMNDGRTKLGKLKPVGKKHLAPISRVGNARLEGAGLQSLTRNPVLPPSQNGRIQVLQDAENIPSVKSTNPLSTFQSDNWNSENQLARKPWSNVKLKSKVTSGQQKPEFKVHEDNEEKMGLGRKLNPAFTTVFRGSHAEKKFGFVEPDDPQKLYVCDFQKLYGGAEEFQLEEIAAALWHQNQKKKQEEDQVAKLKEELEKLKSLNHKNFFRGVQVTDENLKTPTALAECLTQEDVVASAKSPNSTGVVNSGKSTPRSEFSSPTRDVIALWNATLSIPAKDEASNTARETSSHSNLRSVPKSDDQKLSFQVYMDSESVAAPKVKLQRPAFQVYADTDSAQAKKPAFQVYTDSIQAAPKAPINKPAFQIFMDDQENGQPNNPPVSSSKGQDRVSHKDDNFKENQAPSGFVQEVHDKASPYNILRVTDRPIPFGIKDDELEQEEEEEDLGVRPLPDEECHTIGPLTSELHFVQNLKYSSTPCTFNRTGIVSADFVQPMQLIKPSAPEFKTPGNTEKLQLSPIVEASREISKLSSTNATSSSSGSSLAQSTQRFTSSTKSILCPSITVTSPVNPFDPELISNLLSSLNIESRPGYMQMEGDVNRIAKQKTYVFGQHRLHVTAQHVVGGEGIIYMAETEDDPEWPQQIVVKIYKPVNLWEFYICTELQSRLEVPGLADVRESIPSVLLSPVYKSCNLLLMEYCPYGTLVDLVNSYRSQNEVIPENLSLYLTWEILQIVRQLHLCQIIHGDIKPDNFIVLTLPTKVDMLDFAKTRCIRLIDFGQSIDMSLFPRGTTFSGSIKTQNFVCPEMQENKPWTFQTDYFGILGTIHTLLFHEYMEIKKINERWEMKKKFKRYWKYWFWNKLFDTFLNVPDCEHLPDLTPFIEELQQIFDDSVKSCVVQAGNKHLPILRTNKSTKH